MFKIQTLNKISPLGLDQLPRDAYEVASEIGHPDAVIVRSANMCDMELPQSLKAIARAGTGVNNIPVEKCSERGIVVFNTPGANANSVKEIVLASLLISSRKIVQGIEWAKSLVGKGDEVPKIIEKDKSRFGGPEIKGKSLGVIGLGAIGVMVANDACSLGMEVTGYDPFISVESAWDLSRTIRRATGFESLLRTSDYITLHVPLTDETKGVINRDKFALMKKGVRLINFARGGLVNNADLKEALLNGTVSCYVTDFPDEELIKMENVFSIPHLGASTPEAEDNCAVMAARQVRNFLENGNIKNSVNYPNCQMDLAGKKRININDMLNRSKGNNAYNIIDIDSEITENGIGKIRAIGGVTMVRII